MAIFYRSDFCTTPGVFSMYLSIIMAVMKTVSGKSLNLSETSLIHSITHPLVLIYIYECRSKKFGLTLNSFSYLKRAFKMSGANSETAWGFLRSSKSHTSSPCWHSFLLLFFSSSLNFLAIVAGLSLQRALWLFCTTFWQEGTCLTLSFALTFLGRALFLVLDSSVEMSARLLSSIVVSECLILF